MLTIKIKFHFFQFISMTAIEPHMIEYFRRVIQRFVYRTTSFIWRVDEVQTPESFLIAFSFIFAQSEDNIPTAFLIEQPNNVFDEIFCIHELDGKYLGVLFDVSVIVGEYFRIQGQNGHAVVRLNEQSQLFVLGKVYQQNGHLVLLLKQYLLQGIQYSLQHPHVLYLQHNFQLHRLYYYITNMKSNLFQNWEVPPSNPPFHKSTYIFIISEINSITLPF